MTLRESFHSVSETENTAVHDGQVVVDVFGITFLMRAPNGFA